MAHAVQLQMVSTASPVQNVDSSGNVETRGRIVCGKVDVTSYTSGGEVISASEFGLSEIYNGIFWMSENDTYAPRSFEVAAGNRSGTLNVDTAGSGTEITATTDTGEICFVVWGEFLGSGSN